jgi:hypothetical protein
MIGRIISNDISEIDKNVGLNNNSSNKFCPVIQSKKKETNNFGICLKITTAIRKTDIAFPI